MPVNIGNRPLKAAYIGATPLKAIYLGSQQVWTFIKPTEVLLSATNYGTRDNFRALLTKYGLNFATVTELPFNLDTSQVTNMAFVFQGCSSLVSVPDMDTSQVTNMGTMFRGCSSLVSVPDMDTSRVTTMGSMFYGCSALKDGNVRLIRPDGTKPGTRTDMIRNSGLTREPFFLPDGTPIN